MAVRSVPKLGTELLKILRTSGQSIAILGTVLGVWVIIY